MDIFEYNEVCWPTRALQQEEEEQAVPGAEHNLVHPEIKWSHGGSDHTKPRLLVVAMSPASAALLLAAMAADTQEVGQVVQPASPDPTTTSTPSTDKAHAAAGLHAPLPGVLVCCCSTAVAPERAGTWARGVMQQLQPQRLLLLGCMQAEQYRGEADASQELLAVVLRSTQLRQRLEQAPGAASRVPYLPSGSIVSGLPAALLTQAELAGLPAELLVVVEQVPSLVPETLAQLAQLVAGSMRDAGVGGWADRLSQSQVVQAARLKLQRTAYRPCSVYS